MLSRRTKLDEPTLYHDFRLVSRFAVTPLSQAEASALLANVSVESYTQIESFGKLQEIIGLNPNKPIGQLWTPFI